MNCGALALRPAALAVPGGGVRVEEDGERPLGQRERVDHVFEEDQRGDRIVECVVPAASGGESLDSACHDD